MRNKHIFITSLLVCALAIEKSEEWQTGRRYLNMDELHGEENEIIKVEPDGTLIEV
ncbi:MAG: hypothetical protein U9O41_06925 [Candidatus Aerophobetes bacterium]|nr:hypothetical protein [Candidatus Aerophobetes bacterium]